MQAKSPHSGVNLRQLLSRTAEAASGPLGIQMDSYSITTKPTEMQSFDELVECIRKIANSNVIEVIGIEGCLTSGKSYLGKKLIPAFKARLVSTDDSRNDKDHTSTPYLDTLDLSRMHTAIDDIMQTGKLVIVEGICLRSILKRIALTADLFVYVKKLSGNIDDDVWHCGYDIESFEEGEKQHQEPYISDLKYHSRVRPHERADLVYKNKFEGS